MRAEYKYYLYLQITTNMYLINYLTICLFQISHVEAKINMWRTLENDARDPERSAYCRGRISMLSNRLALVSQIGKSDCCCLRMYKVYS